MAIIYCGNKFGGINIKEPHDPNATLDYTFLYKPEAHQTSWQYSKGDVVLPPVFAGFYMECVDSGISGSTAPTFTEDQGDTVVDGTVLWKAREYDFLLDPAETIQVDGMGGYLSTWTATNGVTIINPTATGIATKIWVSAVPAGVTKFSLTNSFETTSGRIDDRTMNIKVMNR